jgi:hypothetical protein
MLEAMKVWETSEDKLILLRQSLGVNVDPADIDHLPVAMVAAYQSTTYVTVGQGNTPDISAKHTHSTRGNSLTELWERCGQIVIGQKLGRAGVTHASSVHTYMSGV